MSLSKKTIYVTGHRNPDSDSIISSMAYAYLKQQLGYNAIAVRIGELNQETKYILQMFNEFAPPLASDIRTRIRDIDFDEVVTCGPHDTLQKCLDILNENNAKVIIVVDEKKQLLGVSTLSDLSKPVMYNKQSYYDLLSNSSLENVVEILNAEVVVDNGWHTNGVIRLIADDQQPDGCIVIGNNHDSIQKDVLTAGCVVICNSGQFDKEVIALAEKSGCTLLRTDATIYETAKKLPFAIEIEDVMTKDPICFNYEDYVNDIKTVINQTRYRSYPILDRRGHVVGMLSRYHLFKHDNRALILVDHNELSQSISGAAEADILEIIDHHRIGGIITSSPVFFRNEQTGSCATIITGIFEEKNVEIPDDLAGMLCCAIISDTVNFQSVTCTQKDIDTAKKLAWIAGLDLETLGPSILQAGASITNKSVEAIMQNDLKTFAIGKNKVAIGQANIVSSVDVSRVKDGMLKHMSSIAENRSYAIVMMVFSLIDGSGSYILAAGDKEKSVANAFENNSVMKDGLMFLPKVMSRKLQILPMLTRELEAAER
ncbi:MAG: putative manganese-dependent inorganic diphosphatase [Erysipelotrichaceae bacterium]|nr:putative manganese-dependent inorganic diphosphatase [Erysipelotrichaceae bacterium]